MQKTVFLGMSGGVDSSVSALILKQQGYNVVGVYMKNWSKDLPGMKCPWAEDLADAKRVATKLDLPFEVWDFESEYKSKVVDYMLTEFKKGNTPNPDIMCNQEIKFNLFLEKAMSRGADFIATGHYARVKHGDSSEKVFSEEYKRSAAGESRSDSPRETLEEKTFSKESPLLLRAVDENKDQTYFLYRMPDKALQKTLFPIGEMLKPDVKKLAEENGLHNAYKKESMGVCFVGEVGMKDFLKEYIDIAPGEIREAETEKVLGYHEGVIFYTIGQRHGLYLGGGFPYYVVKKDLQNNILYVSKDLNNKNLWTTELKLHNVLLRDSDFVFSEEYKRSAAGESRSDSPRVTLEEKLKLKSDIKTILVRLRHRAPLIPATYDPKTQTLFFESPIKRPASGQSAVFYSDEICLGGGIIK